MDVKFAGINNFQPKLQLHASYILKTLTCCLLFLTPGGVKILKVVLDDSHLTNRREKMWKKVLSKDTFFGTIREEKYTE